MARPFEGIRVIDMTHVLAGPFATYMLGVLGADMINVEHPDDPDQSRGTGTDQRLNRAQMGHCILTQSSDKRSITADLKTEPGREIIRRLVRTADVLVENYRPGASEALGFGVPMAAFFAHDGPRIDPPPALGQHNDAVLAEIGYTPAQIAQLRMERVI